MQASVALFLTFQPVSLWKTTLQWKRCKRIGAMPCLWHEGNPYAESEASNAAVTDASGSKTVMPNAWVRWV